jgi:hypothetical protein
MSYRSYMPDPGTTLISLARALHTAVVCHRRDLEALTAAGIPAETLAHGGPQPGELWVAWVAVR